MTTLALLAASLGVAVVLLAFDNWRLSRDIRGVRRAIERLSISLVIRG